MSSDSLITIAQGALGAMTFGAYHQFVTNRMMEMNNEKIEIKNKFYMDKIEIQNKYNMDKIEIQNKYNMDKMERQHREEMKILEEKIERRKWF
jgi:hypothetical protein